MDFKFATKWVSEKAFYTSVEEILRLREVNREPTSPWHPLGRRFIMVQKRKQSTRETEPPKPHSLTIRTMRVRIRLTSSRRWSWTRLNEPTLLPRTTSRAKGLSKVKRSPSLSPSSPRESKTGNKSDRLVTLRATVRPRNPSLESLPAQVPGSYEIWWRSSWVQNAYSLHCHIPSSGQG
ncbi:hypothetical protein PHMEG_00010347 [Phytophthora megakarya]|uniref:Uncharacterized protein n=1 Tax=Phytophthora megakarya TaxID=4795 RepID=A0A225WEW5_9STRA|nr:hypothetical protein PHMEG_00010347 [Phytophthora megakarya]